MAYVGPDQRRQGVYCHEHWTAVGYPLLRSNYDYMVRDVFVQGTVTETYEARTNVEREVSYIFEVPPEASVIKFSAKVGNTQVEAIVEEKAEANKKYQQAKSAGVQAWKLDKVNNEVFQVSLGNVSPNSSIIVSVSYVYVISSDTIEDSVRLTIPAGLAVRPGAPPASSTTIPTAPTGKSAVSIIVGIEVERNAQIFDLNCLSHRANITNGFSDNSFKRLTPVQKQQAYKVWKSHVEFTSDQFLRNHFVLVWTVPRIDQARCSFEQLSPPIPGKPQTKAMALTLVSNIQLEPEEHEYIFLVDSSGSMAGSRIQNANSITSTMLTQLPKVRRSSFNVYNFDTSARSIFPGGRSLGYDTNNVSTAVNQLKTSASGGTNINAALTTVLGQRDTSKPHCSVILITDGLDWGVTAAMQTVQRNAIAAAAQAKLLRVFVMGLGDDVSRGMCEALARAGSGATVYISESRLQDRDHRDSKAQTLINAINRAPIRVRSIDWGMTAEEDQASGSGINHDSRPQPNEAQLGAAAKGDNLPPPKAIQQAPLSGTMFWAVRSYWHAIIHGTFEKMKATIVYDIPGSANSPRKIDVDFGRNNPPGRLIHSLAARALIQTREDEAAFITDSTDKYWKECEIVRLGKTYGLASTQTSFVATMNGVGTCTNVASNAPPGGQSLLSGLPINNTSGLDFVGTQPQAHSLALFAVPKSTMAPSFHAPINVPKTRATPMVSLADSDAVSANAPPATTPPSSSGGDDLARIIAAQDSNGAFDSGTVERIVFPGTSIPAVPALISALQGRNNIKDQIWLTICVIALFQKTHAGHSSKWPTAQSKAEKFVETTLCCIFGVDSSLADSIFNSCLDDAGCYFY